MTVLGEEEVTTCSGPAPSSFACCWLRAAISTLPSLFLRLPQQHLIAIAIAIDPIHHSGLSTSCILSHAVSLPHILIGLPQLLAPFVQAM